MSVRSKEELLEHVITAISRCGWQYDPPDLTRHPLALSAYSEYDGVNLLIYIWNITHGGKTRSTKEYRIQITPSMNIEIRERYRTLLLGLYGEDEREVFVGFDPFKHQKPGSSASIQIDIETIEKAIGEGVAIQEKAREGDKITEVAVAFRPEHFMDYATEIHPSYHMTDITIGEMDAIAVHPEVLRTPQREEIIPKERRKAVGQYVRILRDSTFSLRVLSAYGWKCAICGVQLRLVDASHIIPVGMPGSTDETKNGVALCPNHHRAYDCGLIGITPDYIISVNDKKLTALKAINLAGGETEFKKTARIGEKISIPAKSELHPDKAYLSEGLRIRGFPPF